MTCRTRHRSLCFIVTLKRLQGGMLVKALGKWCGAHRVVGSGGVAK